MRPESSLNEGQIANQFYAIWTRQLITELEIQVLKQEVQEQRLNLPSPSLILTGINQEGDINNPEPETE